MRMVLDTLEDEDLKDVLARIAERAKKMHRTAQR